MSKKHFIELADMIREFNRFHRDGSSTANHFDTQQIEALADFCRSQNSDFKARPLARLGYIAGENGKNGGAK